MERIARFNKLFVYHNTTLSCSITLLLLFPGFAQGVEESVYDQQIQQARTGHYTPFLHYVQYYQQHNALNPEQVADWLQIASWAKRDHDVIQVWLRYQVYMPLPARGVAAAAQSWRNLKEWKNALALWKQACDLAPDNDDYRIDYIKTLADAHMDKQALREAKLLLAEQQTLAHLQTLSYVYQLQGKNWDRLLIDTLAHNISPDDKELRLNLINSLDSNRVSGPALKLAQKTELLPASYRTLELNDAAERVRLVGMPTHTEKERIKLAQATLKGYDTLLTEWKNDPYAQLDSIRARTDRLGALYAAGNYSKVIIEYQIIKSTQRSFPDWAIGWVIASYLKEKNASAAFAVLAQHPKYTPDPQDDEHAFFFTLLDTGQYQAAQQYVNRIAQTAPWARYDFGDPSAQPNDQWLTGQSLKFQYLLMTNALPEAESLAQHLATSAPGNQGLQIDYAALLQARGLPHTAEQKLKMAEALEPSNIELERQQAYVAMDLQEWQQLDLLADDVIARAPLDESTINLGRVRDVHHLSELRINAGKGLHSDNPVSGTHDLSGDAALYGPPVADNWRLFAGTRFAQGNFDEGKGSCRSLFGGVEWRPRDLWTEIEVSNNNYQGNNKPGGRLSVRYIPNDNWQIGGDLERISRLTPLRALRNGISSNRGNTWLRWYQNERREYQFSIAASKFSDHNRRQEYALNGKERLWQAPSLTLDLEPEISASANSLSQVDYYNPRQDLSATASFSIDHLMYRHYDTLWSQQLLAGAGSYWQKNQSTGVITLLSYGQRLQWNNVLDTGVMLNWDKRPYDGKRESNLAITFDANLRF